MEQTNNLSNAAQSAPAPLSAAAAAQVSVTVQSVSGTAQAPATETQASAKQESWPDAVIADGSIWQPAITGWITLAVIFGLAAFGLSRLKKVPGGLQNAWEFAYEWLEEIVGQVMGKDGGMFMPYFFSLFVFIFIANLLGLIPYLASPTARTSTTAALALVTFFATHYFGLRRKGFGYISHFFHIVDASQETSFLNKAITLVLQWVFLPAIEILSEFARPLSLTMRLFGNIFAKEVLLMVLAALALQYLSAGDAKDYALVVMPMALRPGILILGVLVSLIQAVVFTGLSMVYIGGAIAVHEEHEHSAEDGAAAHHEAHAA